MAGFRIEGNTSGNTMEVNAANQAKVVTETNASANPGNVGGLRAFQELDQGLLTGAVSLISAEPDVDYRLRVGQDALLDEEMFNTTAQNTGKHAYNTTTLVNAWTAGQLTTNSGSITTTTTGSSFSTYAFFPFSGTTTLSADTEVGFSAQPQTNSFIEWGTGLVGSATGAPADGVFFRLSSAGLQGIASFNGTEVSTGIFPLSAGAGTWLYTNAKRYQFLSYQSATEAAFWVNDGLGAVLLGSIKIPPGTGRIAMASAGQYFFKHRITGGAAGGVLQATVTAYSMRQGGVNFADAMSVVGSRVFGSYQGLSGGTMGGLSSYANSTNPTAAAPSNTSLAANLPGGLGGQGLVTAAVASATDGIWSEYGVPAGTVNVPGRRLKISGIQLSAINLGAAVATTTTAIQFSLAFGQTGVSLANAESATTKAPRRVPVGFMSWPVGAAIGQQPDRGAIYLTFTNPIYVNPGERVALAGKFLAGTATASQTIQFMLGYDAGWE